MKLKSLDTEIANAIEHERVRLDQGGVESPEGGDGPSCQPAEGLILDRPRQGGEPRTGGVPGQEVAG